MAMDAINCKSARLTFLQRVHCANSIVLLRDIRAFLGHPLLSNCEMFNKSINCK